MSSKRVVDLVNRWAEFEKAYPDAGLEQFCHWVLNTGVQSKEHTSKYSKEADSAQILARLSRYATIYSKDILAKHGLESAYEFGLLMSVLEAGQPKKSELTEKMLMGFTSTIGMINRLIKRGLLKEWTDDTDKRTKRLMITPSGMGALQSCLPDMERLSQIVFSPLNDSEKNMLLMLMKKLDTVHRHAFTHDEEHTIEALGEKIQNSISLYSAN